MLTLYFEVSFDPNSTDKLEMNIKMIAKVNTNINANAKVNMNLNLKVQSSQLYYKVDIKNIA